MRVFCKGPTRVLLAKLHHALLAGRSGEGFLMSTRLHGVYMHTCVCLCTEAE